jgi:ABC-type transporter Mla subunit MlaD
MKFVGFILCALLTASCAGHLNSGNFRFVVKFSQGAALKPGDKVECLGVPVGKVESIAISQSGTSTPPVTNITVLLSDDTIHVRENDSFHVATTGLLGEAYLEIDPGREDSPPIPEGATVRGESGPSLRDLAANFQPLVKIASKLASLPPGKREEVLTKFLQLLDEASKKPTKKATGKNGARQK